MMTMLSFGSFWRKPTAPKPASGAPQKTIASYEQQRKAAAERRKNADTIGMLRRQEQIKEAHRLL
jgi:hypothetical protein